MPPANSPSDTRPSTPPSHPSLTSHPYLQQLEESISTPVPDLASTLTTPESLPQRPSDHRRVRSRTTTSDAWHDQTVLHLSHREDVGTLQAHNTMNQPARDEELARMQSELDRWQTERNRLRSILHNQQSRQSALEEQNYRLREQRSRLQEEHTRLHEQSSRHRPPSPHHTQETYHSSRDSRNTISNLANAINHVGNDSYATTGAGPSRQRLYDWAAARPPPAPRDDPDSVQLLDTTGDVDSVPRRELERALRNYRMARSAFRSGRQPANDLSVPTASALRAYWSEEPNEQPANDRPDHASSSRQPFVLSEFVEQHRLERQRRHLDVIRRQNEQSQGHHQSSSASLRTLRNNTTMPTDAFVRVRTTLKYLSALRHTNSKHSLDLARSFGLDSLHQYADATSPSNLPLHVDSLPSPQPSSWLTPGMTWHGLQSTDREPPRPPVLTRRQRRENLGISMARSRLAENRSSYSLLSEFTPSTQPLDTDRYISSLMQDSEGRWGFNDEQELSSSLFEPPLNHPTQTLAAQDVDHWPVTVTLHSVDFDTMTVSGTMRASQLPDKIVSSPNINTDSPEKKQQDLKSMESYFLGEVIDFRNHTFETSGSTHNPPYKSGGVDVDARYWSRLGPFRREIDKHLSSCSVNGKVWDIKLKDSSKYLDSETLEGAGVWGTGMTREQREEEADEVMAKCLGDGKWLEEKMGKKGGEWVLMRWKEQCFVDPILSPSPTPPSEKGTTITAMPTSNSDSTSPHHLTSDSHPPTWGLTISGFYYVALNRITGALDGLYYDPGSQPFQSLNMIPVQPGLSSSNDGLDVVGMKVRLGLVYGPTEAATSLHQQDPRDQQCMQQGQHEQQRPLQQHQTQQNIGSTTRNQDLLLKHGIGIRRAWPAIEFR